MEAPSFCLFQDPALETLILSPGECPHVFRLWQKENCDVPHSRVREVCARIPQAPDRGLRFLALGYAREVAGVTPGHALVPHLTLTATPYTICHIDPSPGH